jgi:hypothetical protein
MTATQIGCHVQRISEGPPEPFRFHRDCPAPLERPHSAKVPLSALREVVTSVVKHANSLPYLMHLSYACQGVKP